MIIVLLMFRVIIDRGIYWKYNVIFFLEIFCIIIFGFSIEIIFIIEGF